MEQVKISFNKQTWSEDGTYFRGCFTVTEKLFKDFAEYVVGHLSKYQNQTQFSTHEMNELMYLPGLELKKDKWSGRHCLFMTLTQRDKLVQFLREKGIQFNLDRAYGGFNYYIEIR